jgi:hypothetical protein
MITILAAKKIPRSKILWSNVYFFGEIFFVLNNEILANFLLAKQEGKKFQCKGYKTLLLEKKKSTKVPTFLRKEIGHCDDRKENTVQKGIKKRFEFGKIAPNSPHFEERNSEATIFRQ